MTSGQIKVQFEGDWVAATPVEWKPVKEEVSVYELDDGHRLRLRPVLLSVARIEGRKSPDGHPLYHAQVQLGMIAERLVDTQHAPDKDPA